MKKNRSCGRPRGKRRRDTSIQDSANSNVIVYIDNISLAYALLCCFYATERVNELEFERMVHRLNNLLKNDEYKKMMLRAANSMPGN